MRKKSFTLLQIMIVVVILGIMVTLGIPGYINFIENSNKTVCETQLKARKVELDIYAMEHDVLPGDLSQIPPEYLKRAYAQIMQEKGSWKIRLAFLIRNLKHKGLAFAGLLHDLVDQNEEWITCPADPTPPPGGVSYGMNAALANMSSSAYKALASNVILIGDCDSPTFTNISELAQRHKHAGIGTATYYALVITKNGDILTSEEIEEEGLNCEQECHDYYSECYSNCMGEPGCQANCCSGKQSCLSACH